MDDFSTTRMLTGIEPSFEMDSNSLVRRRVLLPPNVGRQGEGGLRTKGWYKCSQPGKPLVSILTAVFNSATFLEDTILSVLSQDYDNLELIIIDGGSSDATQDVIRKYEHAIDYWISEPDEGISDAFNKAVILAAGDYVNFQGAGDYLVANDVVSGMMERVDADSDMLVCGRVQRVTATSERKVIQVFPKKYSAKFNKRSLLFRMSLPHQALFTHKKMFDLYGLFDTKNVFSMDYEHLLRAYHNFPKVILRDIIFSAWREGGIGSGRVSEILREYSSIKIKNKVAPPFFLKGVEYWIYFKYFIKSLLTR